MAIHRLLAEPADAEVAVFGPDELAALDGRIRTNLPQIAFD
jgi:hypothetical protein